MKTTAKKVSIPKFRSGHFWRVKEQLEKVEHYKAEFRRKKDNQL